MTRAERFGPYLLLELLGEGGMAEVWLARQEMEGVERLLAVKRMHETLHSDEAFVQMFLDELGIALTLCHPNIGHIFDVGEIDGRYFLAMEHLPGRDLATVLDHLEAQGEILPLEILYAVGQGVAAALDHAHTRTRPDGEPRGIVHRDVSPDNVILTFDGRVKLVDFGIAKTEGRLARTEAGTLKGKPPYMAPEQILGEKVDGRADLFALGSLLYRAGTGRHPFSGKTPERIFHKVIDFTPRSAHRVEPSLPVLLGEAIAQAMAKDPDERPGDAETFLATLEAQSARLDLLLSPKHLAAWMHARFPETAGPPGSEAARTRIARDPGKQHSQHTIAGRVTDPGGATRPDAQDPKRAASSEPATQVSARIPEASDTRDDRGRDGARETGRDLPEDPADAHTRFEPLPPHRARGAPPRRAPGSATAADAAAPETPRLAAASVWSLEDHWAHLPEHLRAPAVVGAAAALAALLLFLAAVGLRALLG